MITIVTPNVFADDNWKTLDVVGKYTHSEPPIPDQTFSVPYRVSNGTLISISGGQTGIIAMVKTTENGLLEVKFPRNFPYTNQKWEGDMFLMINGYGPHVYYLPETTMKEHVRGKIINDINRPPPYPESFTHTADCYYIFEIPFYTFARIEIVYGANGLITRPYHGDDIPDYCNEETVSDIKRDSFYYLSSPLKQEKAGIRLGQIVCSPDKTLVWKINSEKPACVKPESVSKLVSRSWATQELMNSFENNPVMEFELTGRNYLIKHMIDRNKHHYEKRQLAIDYADNHLDGKKFVHYYFQNVANNYYLGNTVVFTLYSWGNDFLGECTDRKMVIKNSDRKIIHEQEFEIFCPEQTKENSWFDRIRIDEFTCLDAGLYTIHIVDNKQQTTSKPLEAFSCIV